MESMKQRSKAQRAAQIAKKRLRNQGKNCAGDSMARIAINDLTAKLLLASGCLAIIMVSLMLDFSQSTTLVMIAIYGVVAAIGLFVANSRVP
jgi:hypothetical protein